MNAGALLPDLPRSAQLRPGGLCRPAVRSGLLRCGSVAGYAGPLWLVQLQHFTDVASECLTDRGERAESDCSGRSSFRTDRLTAITPTLEASSVRVIPRCSRSSSSRQWIRWPSSCWAGSYQARQVLVDGHPRRHTLPNREVPHRQHLQSRAPTRPRIPVRRRGQPGARPRLSSGGAPRCQRHQWSPHGDDDAGERRRALKTLHPKLMSPKGPVIVCSSLFVSCCPSSNTLVRAAASARSAANTHRSGECGRSSDRGATSRTRLSPLRRRTSRPTCCWTTCGTRTRRNAWLEAIRTGALVPCDY